LSANVSFPTETPSEIKQPSLRQFSKQIGEESEFLHGKSLLFEVDPSSSYEKAVKDFADELSSHGVFVFTHRSSRVYKVLSTNPNFGFFSFSSSVSYPKKSDRANEFLVPQNDAAIWLDLMSKTQDSSKGNPVVFIFDSVSDMIVSSGFQETYKFLKSMMELLGPNVTSLFLSMPSIHDTKINSVIRSMFSNHMTNDKSSGVKLTKRI
jgi:hypothetical protein